MKKLKPDSALSDNNEDNRRLIEKLSAIDLSGAVKSASGSSPTAGSYEQLYEIARSIIQLNVDKKDTTSSKERSQHDETLTKLLQTCQTVIDFLLTDVKRLDREQGAVSKNDFNNYQNNLLQENVKLRKLLTLQQKAIAFRRVSLWSGNGQSIGDEDDVTTADNLPEDSSSSRNSSTSTRSAFQCIYCPKIFTDSNSFAKHLSLRHLSSSIDDGLPNSISSSGGTYLQRLRVNATKQLEIHQHQAVIDNLQEEISKLKTKLSDTEKALDHEKNARHSFEDELKNGLAANVLQIQAQLLEKIEEIKNLRNEKIDPNSSRSEPEVRSPIIKNEIPYQPEEPKPKPDTQKSPTKSRKAQEMESLVEKLEAKVRQQQEILEKVVVPEPPDPKPNAVEEEIDQIQQIDDKDSSLSSSPIEEKPLEKSLIDHKKQTASAITTVTQLNLEPQPSIEVDQPIPTATEMKKSLRLELISQLTAKREERHLEVSPAKLVEQEVVKKSKKPKKSTEIVEKVTQPGPKELTKAEIHSSIESRLREYLDSSTATSINASISAKEDAQLDESRFSEAMSKVQRDRDLLIQQSRHDYDFVQIENNLRDLIDSKVRSKLTANQKSQSIEEVEQNGIDEVDDYLVEEPPEPSAPEEENEEIEPFEENVDDEIMEITDDNQEEQSVQIIEPLAPETAKESIEETNLKSILKTRKNRKTRRRSFDTEPVDESSNSRRISFADQIIEYPISPRESSEDSDVEDEDDEERLELQVPYPANGKRNQMFVIRSIESKEQTYSRPAPDQRSVVGSDETDSFSGEKVYFNDYSSSSSSSSEEDEPAKQPDHQQSDSTPPNKTIQQVEVHQEANNNHNKITPLQSIPQPAQRKSKTSSTLNSLLLTDDIATDELKSTRVHELAELIERKLQQTNSKTSNGSSELASTSDQRRKPPAGAVDTLSAVRSATNSKNTLNDDYDIYDF